MSDLIRREDAVKALKRYQDLESNNFTDTDPVIMMTVATIANCIEEIVKIPSAEPERKIIRCEDCIYFDPAHVEKDGLRYEYKDMPEEAYGPFGTHGCVTVKYGINVGSRCTYEQDNMVFRQRNDFCSRAEMRGEL